MTDRDKRMRLSERFKVEVIERFGFLCQLPQFVGPQVAEDTISYHSSEASVHIVHNTAGHSVITVVMRSADDVTLRAELSCLFASAGLGPAQGLKWSARTSREVAAAIATQAEALRPVLQLLIGPGGDELIRRCHARY